MTDEGQMGEPIDELEMLHALKGVGEASYTMFRSFIDHGFTEAQAMRLVSAWLHGSAGGKLE